MSRADRVVRRLLRTEFLVTMKTGQTWQGILLEVDDRTLVLHSAAEIQPDGTRVSADGQIYLPRSDVAYMQHA